MDGECAARAMQADCAAMRLCMEDNGLARILIDPTAHILWRSGCASLLMAGDSPFFDAGGRFRGRDARSEAVLAECIADAVSGKEACRLVKRGQDRRFLLRVRLVEGGDEAALVVTFKDFDAPVQLPQLGQVFGLSAAETATLNEIIAGKNADRIAADKRVSILTVRTHIKHIHSKMGVRSKEEILANVVRIFA